MKPIFLLTSLTQVLVNSFSRQQQTKSTEILKNFNKIFKHLIADWSSSWCSTKVFHSFEEFVCSKNYRFVMVEKIQDISLPNAVVARLIKEALPDGINVGKEARTAISRAAAVFGKLFINKILKIRRLLLQMLLISIQYFT